MATPGMYSTPMVDTHRTPSTMALAPRADEASTLAPEPRLCLLTWWLPRTLAPPDSPTSDSSAWQNRVPAALSLSASWPAEPAYGVDHDKRVRAGRRDELAQPYEERAVFAVLDHRAGNARQRQRHDGCPRAA